MKKRIAIQGFEGSFHQVAAEQFYNDVEVICCSTFREVVKIAADKKASDGGVMAIENSIAGSILPNYNLLQKNQFKNNRRGIPADKTEPASEPGNKTGRHT